MHIALQRVCELGLANVYVDLHTCDKARWGVVEWQKDWGTMVYTNGPIYGEGDYESFCEAEKEEIRRQAGGVPPAWIRTGRGGELVRSLPVILWLRDPISRLTACWNFFLNLHSWREWKHAMAAQNQSIYTPRGTLIRRSEVVRWLKQAAAPIGLHDRNQARDLNTVLFALQQHRNDSLLAAKAAFRHVDHAMTGINFYVGGLRGLRGIKRNLLFVGTTETMMQSWEGLVDVLVHTLGWGKALPPNTTTASLVLPHTHSSSSGRRQHVLNASSVAFARRMYLDDYKCIDWLVSERFLPFEYLDIVHNDSKVYKYDTPPKEIE